MYEYRYSADEAFLGLGIGFMVGGICTYFNLVDMWVLYATPIALFFIAFILNRFERR